MASIKYLAGVFMLIISFGYGAVVGKYEIFPHDFIAGFKHLLSGVAEDRLVGRVFPERYETTHVALKVDVYNFVNDLGLSGWGGGLLSLDSQLIGLDRVGRFFWLDDNEIKLLSDLRVPTAEAHLVELVRQEDIPLLIKNRIINNFKVLDVDFFGDYIYISHHFFDVKTKSKTLVISRIEAKSFDDLRLSTSSDFELFFSLDDRVRYDMSENSSFRSNRAGGGIAFDDSGNLFLGVGDYQLDGLEGRPKVSQANDSPYGKVLKIGGKGKASVFASGLRNPQGLEFSEGGALVSVGHGPKGGDELNVLKRGANYGWPNVTFGTDYGALGWPLQDQQANHMGYEKPIFSWLPSIGPSSIEQVTWPSVWSGDLLIGGLANQSLHRLRYAEGRIIFDERIHIGERVRDVLTADGAIFLWTDNARLLRLSKATKDQSQNGFTAQDKELGLPDLVRTCSECHSGRGSPTRLPSLETIWGARIASSDYEGYSTGLELHSGKFWREDNLAQFLSDPAEFAYGSPMSQFRIVDDKLLHNLIDYLRRSSTRTE